MKYPISQDSLDPLEELLKDNTIDWKRFFHLDTDQRATAERLFLGRGIISTEEKGNYKVSPGIRGIVPGSRAPRDNLENLPTYFTSEAVARTLLSFYKERNIQTSIKQL